jgi:hypothetical protein
MRRYVFNSHVWNSAADDKKKAAENPGLLFETIELKLGEERWSALWNKKEIAGNRE